MATEASRPRDAASVTYLDAVSQALREEMRRDPRVIILGEDIGAFGGAFKITRGFLDEFGPERVIDTPISESGFVGAACAAQIEAAVDWAMAQPMPDPATVTWRLFAGPDETPEAVRRREKR